MQAPSHKKTSPPFLQRIQAPDGPTRTVVLPASIVRRGTDGPPPG